MLLILNGICKKCLHILLDNFFLHLFFILCPFRKISWLSSVHSLVNQLFFKYILWNCKYITVAKTPYPNKALSVPVWESVPGARSNGQPIWLKIGTKVGCDKIFQRPFWFTSLTVCSGVSGGSHLWPVEHQISSF